jgi:hypothetical protein
MMMADGVDDARVQKSGAAGWVLSQTTSGWTRRMQARFTEPVLARWLAVVLLQPVNAFGFIWINCARSLDQPYLIGSQPYSRRQFNFTHCDGSSGRNAFLEFRRDPR